MPLSCSAIILREIGGIEGAHRRRAPLQEEEWSVLRTGLPLSADLNDSKPFAPQGHIRRELAQAREVGFVRVSPEGQSAVSLALIIRECGVHFEKPPLSEFHGLDDRAWAV